MSISDRLSGLRGYPFARALWDWIKRNPHLYDQEVFRSRTRCGSVGCFAGTGATLAGCTWASDDPRDWRYTMLIPPDGGELVSPAEWAAERFGMDYEDAWRFFFDGNLSPEQIEAALDEWGESGTAPVLESWGDDDGDPMVT